MMTAEIENYKSKAKQLRKDILRMTTKANAGHVTSSFSCTELFVALYYGGLLKYDAKNPKWEDRDYFIYSKGHASPIIYCVLADLGFFPKEELNLFAQAGGKFGVLLKADVPGVEIISGSLGHGLGIAAGIAESFTLDKKKNKVFCMLGDGECREGSVWEAAMHIGSRKLKNIVTIVDKNQLAAVHFTEEEAPIEPLDKKFEACGFTAFRINGHNFSEIFSAFNEVERQDVPCVIIAETVKGKGVSFIENKPLMHGCAVGEQDLEKALAEVEKGLLYE
jgi:transketolase